MSFITFQGKQLYFKEIGSGPLLFLLHGNTASGNMFEGIKELYQGYHLVIPDFIGHGRSSRVTSFPTDLWYDQGLQIQALREHFCDEQVILVGSSGGAIAALHAAQMNPARVTCVIADSLDGETPDASLLDALKQERTENLASEEGSVFYRYMHGEHFREIVDMDTEMLYAFVALHRPYFHRPLCELQVPTLLIGTLEDEFVSHIEHIYQTIVDQNTRITSHIFKTGGHPAMLSNAKACADVIHMYLQTF